MTLNDITVSALAQLDRGHDAQSLDTWRDKLARFANDAVTDLFGVYKPRRTEEVQINRGSIDLSTLSRQCLRVCSVSQGGKAMDFSGGDTGAIKLSGSGTVQLTYCYAPREMTSPTDAPELPDWMHGLVVTYVVARERAAGDASLQPGCSIYFQMYESGKRAIRPHSGDPHSYELMNRW